MRFRVVMRLIKEAYKRGDPKVCKAVFVQQSLSEERDESELLLIELMSTQDVVAENIEFLNNCAIPVTKYLKDKKEVDTERRLALQYHHSMIQKY